MNPEFWHERWKDNKIGFHQENYNQHLINHIKKLPPFERIFLPLCGKSKDMVWLMEQGFYLYGVELSEKAILSFFEEQNIQHTISEIKNFKVFTAENCTIYCGDLFELDENLFENCQAIYDRASLIALPEKMRRDYVAKLNSLFPGFQSLLLTIEYDQTKVDGPPFNVSRKEVEELFKNKNISLLDGHKTEKVPKKMEDLGIEVIQNIYKIT
jgi:thiopurine S-methyltransferase